MSETEGYNRRARCPREKSPDESLDRSRRHRRKTDDNYTARERSRSPLFRLSKRSRSPRRRRDEDQEDDSDRYRKRRRSYEDTKEKERQSRRHKSRSRSRSRSRSHRRSHKRHDTSRSPRRHHRRHYSPETSRSPALKSRRSLAPLPSQQDAFTSTSNPNSLSTKDSPFPKQKPNYTPSGKLAAETNTVAGTNIILKYNEPPEARKPSAQHAWRMYEFKDPKPEPLSTIELYTRSCWLFGREKAVVDFAIEHPSCSKQHAVLQFRYVEKKNEFGDKLGGVRLYVIDLDSANGTKVNGEQVEGRRYVEVRSGDVVRFGESTREYVVMLPPKE